MPASGGAWEAAALQLHGQRLLSLSYPRPSATGDPGTGPVAAHALLTLLVPLDSVQLALRDDPLALKICAAGGGAAY